MLEWFMEIFMDERVFAFAMLIGAAVLLAGAILSYVFRTTGIFAAVVALTLGGVFLLSLFYEVGAQARAVGISIFLIFGGVSYLLLFFAIYIKNGIVERKRRRAEIARRLCYTLPDRENSYVRTRLNTALQVQERNVNADMGTSQGTEPPIKLTYARGLLSKVKEVNLSQAERLQVEEMERTFSMYLYKQSWSAEDARAVGELCAALLKLSAKYAVAV